MRPVHALQSMRQTRPRLVTVPRPVGTYSWHWTHWPGYRFVIGFDGLDALDWRLKTRCKPRFRMAWHVALTGRCDSLHPFGTRSMWLESDNEAPIAFRA